MIGGASRRFCLLISETRIAQSVSVARERFTLLAAKLL